MSSAPNVPDQAQDDSYKRQLDRVATDRRGSPQDDNSTNPIVEKITEYIPAASKILGTKQDQQDANATKDVPGPPDRPHHDHKIEDFVRDQHRSITDEGVLNTGKSSSV